MKSKLLALILAVLMLVPSFVACSDGSKDSESESKKDPAQSDNTPVDDGSEGNYRNLEKKNLGGYTFNVYGGGYTTQDIADVGNIEFIYVDGITGEDLFDDMHTRFVDVGSAFNVKFNFTGSLDTTELPNAIKQSITAGTHDYSATYYYVDQGSEHLVYQNYLYNICDIGLNLEDPWWDKGAQENLMINGKMYMLFSAISFSHYESGAMLFYNNQLLEDKNIKQTPYDLWKEGKWTIDALQNMTEKAATDKNNDGKYRKGADTIGLYGVTLRRATLVLASGENFIKWNNETNKFELNFTDERVMAIGDATRRLWDESPWNNNSNGDDIQKIFKSGKLVFLSDYLGQFRSLRDSDDPYAISLWPTLDENMDPKVHLRNPTGLAILSDCTDEEIAKISVILTALATYSYDYILEDYVRLAVIAKSSHDEKSAEVMRYALQNTAYDTAAAFGIQAHHWWNNACSGNTYASEEMANKGSFQSWATMSFYEKYFPEEEAE